MGIVYQTDNRTHITYAYERKSVWSEEKGKMVVQRKLLGRVVDMNTKEILPTDGRCRRRSPYLTEDERAALTQDESSEFRPAVVSRDTAIPDSSSAHDESGGSRNTRDSVNIADELRNFTQILSSMQQDIRTICTLLSERHVENVM